MTDTRLQRLEALLARVRRRTAEARGAAASSPPAASTPDSQTEDAVTIPPPVSRQAPLPPARSLPVQAPESGWPEAPEQVADVMVARRVSDIAELEVVENEPAEALGEEDLLEIPSDMLESIPPGAVSEEAEEEAEEEPPASSKRPKVAHLDELEAASEALSADEAREVPIKTPPPESGPQASPPASLAAPPPPDVAHLLDQEISPPAAAAEQFNAPFDSLEQPFGTRPPPPASGPTVEQLGQTIELEEGAGPELELDRPLTSAVPTEAHPDDLEAALPAQESAGAYHDALMPPPQAELDLEAHRERHGAPLPEMPSAIPEVAVASAPPLATMPAASTTTAGELSQLIQRPPVGSADVLSVSGVIAKVEPRTFLQLLDASIALGG